MVALKQSVIDLLPASAAKEVVRFLAVLLRESFGRDYSIEGHPIAAYNGAYTQESEHEGSPVYKNAEGRYCYFAKKGDWSAWVLNDKFTPGKSVANGGFIKVEAGGGLPEGARTWECLVESKWVERTVTVTPPVRLNLAHLLRISPTL